MQEITLNDLEIIGEKFKPKFLGMKEEDIFRIKYFEGYISGYNEKGEEVYYENSRGFWRKREYNEQGLKISFEDSTGYWNKTEYNEKGEEVYFENSDGYWRKTKYNKKGEETSYKDSDGDWRKVEGNNEIECKNGKYYVNGKEAILKTNN